MSSTVVEGAVRPGGRRRRPASSWCWSAAGSVVRGEFPEFAVLRGNPACLVGDTRGTDAALLQAHPEARSHYELWAGAEN